MIIDSYLIKYINDEISVFENNDGSLEILKKYGEEVQAFCHDDFWKWFKTKIGYKKQSISFVILSDKDEFLIDDKITIAQENSFLSNDLAVKKIQEQSGGLNIISFPDVEDLKSIKRDDVKEETAIKIEIDTRSENNIANYFRNETKSYRDE